MQEENRDGTYHCYSSIVINLLSGVIPAPHLTSSQASTWVKTPQVGLGNSVGMGMGRGFGHPHPYPHPHCGYSGA